jgi:uncharacterized DUF497 family protein
MDVYVVVRGVAFVWDLHKASANLAKHRVSFDEACEVFFDPLAVFEDASVPEENRLAAIGRELNGRLLYVVHVVWEDERIRIISARDADAKARRDYEDVG